MARGITAHRTLDQARQRRAHNAMLLLTVTGAVRRANVEVRYRGSDRLLGTWATEMNQGRTTTRVPHRSLWHTDLQEFWNTDLRVMCHAVSAQISTTAQHVFAVRWVEATLGRVLGWVA